MPDGSVDPRRDQAGHAQPGHARRQDRRRRRARRRAQRRGDRPRRRGLRLQQRRVRLARRDGLHHPRQPAATTTAAGASSGSTWPPAKSTVLYARVRRPSRLRGPNDLVFDDRGRVLVHRPRQDPRAGPGPRRRLLRQGRRVVDHRGACTRPTRPTGSGSRRTARPSTTPRPTPAGCSSGRSPAPAAGARPTRSTRPSCWWACPGAMLLDSLAVDSAGNVCVGTLGLQPGITVDRARRAVGARSRCRPSTSIRW